MNTGSLFEKEFPKITFNLEKNKLSYQIGLTKISFSTYLTLFLRKAVKVLAFVISVASSDMFFKEQETILKFYFWRKSF